MTHFQILNEPVYTDYALPRQFGYTLDDYLRLLEIAYRRDEGRRSALPHRRRHQREPGRPAGRATSSTQGGLRFVDVFDLHMYDPARRPRASKTRSARWRS